MTVTPRVGQSVRIMRVSRLLVNAARLDLLLESGMLKFPD